jgi:putative ABC transport system permease protein
LTRIAGYWQDLLSGLSALLGRKLRSVFTIFGLALGVGAIMVLLAAGGSRSAERLAESLGQDNVLVESRAPEGLTLGDVRAIGEQLPGIAALAAARILVPMDTFPRASGDVPLLAGVSPAFASVFDVRLAEGRFFDGEDERIAAPVCVLGEVAKLSLLGFDPAVGKYIKIDGVWLRVIGVLKTQQRVPAELSGFQLADRGRLILVPLESFERRMEPASAVDQIDGIAVRVAPGSDPGVAAAAVGAILGVAHPGMEDFHMAAPGGLIEQQRRRRVPFLLVTLGVSILSLLLGGLGIMNMMFTAILERTTEIGVRRAFGARQVDIARQFLTEAASVAAIGGLAGLVLGTALCSAVERATSWPVTTRWLDLVAAFGISLATAVAFALQPARQASMVSPVEAMRTK